MNKNNLKTYLICYTTLCLMVLGIIGKFELDKIDEKMYETNIKRLDILNDMEIDCIENEIQEYMKNNPDVLEINVW